MINFKQKAQGIAPEAKARNISEILDKTGNIYESIVAASKRSTQISQEIKQELHQKLDEFATHSDTLEEVLENKEQIEISKFYERLPNPAVFALTELIGDELRIWYKPTTVDAKPKPIKKNTRRYV